MRKPALLLLAHQARSYASMIKTYVDRLDTALLILSSRPRDARDLARMNGAGAARLWVAEDDYLDESHVAATLDEASEEGFTVVAALATFEGYRLLMAGTNRSLGAPDAEPRALRVVMDKLYCRACLHEAGLSDAHADVLDADSLRTLYASGRALFVKPRRGAGSFACFRLDATVTSSRLEALQEQMQNDLAFRAIFAGQFDFIAEDYIHGDEYSFEVIAAAGKRYVIGVHAKYVEDTTGTTLEMGNSLPAPRLTDAQQRDGECFIDVCLSALGLDEGCYHIEARYDAPAAHWDIIEINARMGGALINQSVGVFTGGLSMLEIWVRTLCCTRASAAPWRAELANLRESARRANGTLTRGTVFFSRYGKRGCVLEGLSIAALTPPPDIVDLPVRPHTLLPDSERGIFVFNALWEVAVSNITTQLPVLAAMVDKKLIVRYSDPLVTGAELTIQEKL